MRAAHIPLYPRVASLFRHSATRNLLEVSAGKAVGGIWKGQISERLQSCGFFREDRRESEIDIGLIINADGFAPLGKYSGKSTWCIYAQIANYPAHLRCKVEHSLCLGIVFGSPKVIDTFYRKLIDELLFLFNDGQGRMYAFRVGDHEKAVRCRVIAVFAAMDLRALQKSACIMQDPALKCCPYCLFVGQRVGAQTAYGFFAESPCIHRTHAGWKTSAEICEALSPKDRKKLGFHRLTEWARLPYVDLAEFWVLDAMHLIYLGLVRRLMSLMGCSSIKSHLADQEQLQVRATNALGVGYDSSDESDSEADASAEDTDTAAEIDEECEEGEQAAGRQVLPRLCNFRLSESSKLLLEERLKTVVYPLLYCGDRPKNVSRGAGKAAQWRVYVHTSLLYSLDSIVPPALFQLLREFVRIVTELMKPRPADGKETVTGDEVRKWLLSFERMFGSAACSVNVHLFSHIVESRARLGGSLREGWLFGFERWNYLMKAASSHVKRTPEWRMIQMVQIQELLRSNTCHSDSTCARPSAAVATKRTAIFLTDAVRNDCQRLLQANLQADTQVTVDVFYSALELDSLFFPKFGKLSAGSRDRCSYSRVVRVYFDEDSVYFGEPLRFFEVTADIGGEKQQFVLAQMRYFPVSTGPAAKKYTGRTGLQVIRRATLEEEQEWMEQTVIFASQIDNVVALAPFKDDAADHEEDAANTFIVLPVPP